MRRPVFIVAVFGTSQGVESSVYRSDHQVPAGSSCSRMSESMLSVTREADALTASRAKCVCRVVLRTRPWPRSCPIIERLLPRTTAREAKLGRLFRFPNNRHMYPGRGRSRWAESPETPSGRCWAIGR